MYKALFKLIIAMIFQPSRTWKMLESRYYNDGKIEVEPQSYEMFLKHYLYPFIGILTLASFFSICTRQEFDLEIALKSSVVTFVSTYGGYHLAAYVLNEFWAGYCKRFLLFIHICIIYILYCMGRDNFIFENRRSIAHENDFCSILIDTCIATFDRISINHIDARVAKLNNDYERKV